MEPNVWENSIVGNRVGRQLITELGSKRGVDFSSLEGGS